MGAASVSACVNGACLAGRVRPRSFGETRPAGADMFCVRVHGGEGYAETRERARRAGYIGNPRVAAWVMEPLSSAASRRNREHAWSLLLDIYAQFVAVDLIAIGQRDRVSVDLPQAMQAAVAAENRYVVFSHNHPSGYAWPSDADQVLSYELATACAESGLVLLDSLVLGRDEAFSFQEWSMGRAGLFPMERR